MKANKIYLNRKRGKKLIAKYYWQQFYYPSIDEMTEISIKYKKAMLSSEPFKAFNIKGMDSK